MAVDYRVTVSPLRPLLRSAIAASVFQSDRALRLAVNQGHTVIVLGYTGEPFVRLRTAGVEVNENSLTAAGVGLLRSSPRKARGGVHWVRRSPDRALTWHDARLQALPASVNRGRWMVPLIVDGRPARLVGEISRVGAPPPWPWLALGLPFVVVVALILRRRRVLVHPAAAGFGLLAAAGAIATDIGLSFDSYTSEGKWLEAGNVLVFALVGAAFIARGSATAQSYAGGALGLLGLGVALSKVPVLLHGEVLSVLPAAVARIIVVLTIWAGAAAAFLGLVAFDEDTFRPTPENL